MYLSLYAELCLMCIAVLAIILFRMGKRLDRQTANTLFIRTCVLTMAVLCTDVAWTLVEGRSWLGNMLVNLAYMFFDAFAFYSFWLFAERRLARPQRSRAEMAGFLVPLVVACVLAVVSVWTGWVFTIDAANAYHRGPLHPLFAVLTLVYPAVAALQAYRRFSSSTTKYLRNEARTLLILFGAPVLGTIIEVPLYGLPCLWPVTTLCLLMAFINFQEYSISTDALTGLNNRRRFDERVQALTVDTTLTDPVYMLMIDVDHFKAVNDTYGHLAGDEALIETAGILKHIVAGTNASLARLGGDEFAIVGSFSRSKAENMRYRIETTLEERNRTTDKPYLLGLSVGIGEFKVGGQMTADELINIADQDMYAVKARRREKFPSS